MANTFTKQPAEQYPIAFDYFEKLPAGTELSSGIASAVDTSDDSDASNTVLQSTIATISGTQARIGVQAGTSGKTYQITCKVTLDDGSILEDEATMTVTES